MDGQRRQFSLKKQLCVCYVDIINTPKFLDCMFVKVEFVLHSRHWKLEVSKDITVNQIVLPTKSFCGWAYDSAFHAKSICFRKIGKSFYRFNYRVCLLPAFTKFTKNSELPWIALKMVCGNKICAGNSLQCFVHGIFQVAVHLCVSNN